MAIGSVSCLIMLSVLGLAYAPLHNNHNTQKAEALIAIDVVDLIFDILVQIWEAYTWVIDNWMRYKEQYLDGIVWTLINMVIQEMIQQLTDWVNSGFQGEPAFLGNPGQFLTGIADNAFGSFLASTQLGNLICSPFEIDVRYALQMSYLKSRNNAPTCTVTGALANVQNFLADGIGFNEGGWASFFKVTQDPRYNPYGSLMLAQEELSLNINGAKDQEMKLVGNANNFLSSKDCETITDPGYGTYQECWTTTPGSTIEKQLNESLTSGSRRIEVADEFNELLGAFLSQVAQQALRQALAPNRASGAPAPQLGAGLAVNAPPATGANPIAQAIASETAYRTALQSSVNVIDDARTYKDDTYPPIPIYEVDFNGISTGVIIGYQPNNCHSGQLPPALQAEYNTRTAGVARSTQTITQLQAISARYNAAQTAGDAAAQQAALQEFFALQSTSELHPEGGQVILQVDIPITLGDMITAFKQQVDAACRVINIGGGA